MNDDQQQHLIDLAIKYAGQKDWYRITGEMIDALIDDRQSIIDASISVIVGDKEPF